MTVIVSICENNKVYIGADSAVLSLNNLNIAKVSHPKVFKKNGIIFAACGSPNTGTLLRYSFEVPERLPEHETDEDYLYNELVPCIRDCFTEHSFIGGEDGFSEGDAIMIGYGGKSFTLFSNFMLDQCGETFDAIGIAGDLALGALAALSTKWSPEKRITRTLEICAERSAAVCAPFHLEIL